MLEKRIKNTIKSALGHYESGVYYEANAEDIFLVSYPKSGNTWLRFILANLYLKDIDVGFNNIESIVQEVYAKKINRNSCSSIILKSHEPFMKNYKKVIYIYRDPRDVFLSYYSYQKKMGLIDKDCSIEMFSNSFISGSCDQFSSWANHVGSWLGARSHNDDFLVLKYEDLLTDTYKEIKRINDFLGLNRNEEEINEVIRLSSSDSMKKLEKKQENEWSLTKNSNKDIKFVRKARSGYWKDELPIEINNKIVDAWGRQMKEYGYTL